MEIRGKELVLIVDDNPNNIQVLATIMAECGYELGIAQNAQEVYQFLEENMPELILLDVEMPEVDGYEVCTKIKSDPKWEEIPVIFLTVKSEMEDIVKGFDLGAVDYMTKPFNRKELISRVRTHLALKRSRDELAKKNLELEHFIQVKSQLEREKDLLTEELVQHRDFLEKMVDERTKELATANNRIISIMDSITDGFAVLDKEWRFVFVNNHPFFPQEIIRKAVIGKSIWETFPGLVGTEAYNKFQRSMQERVSVHLELPALNDEIWFEISVYPFEDGVCSFIKDITEKKKYESEMKRLSGLDLIGQMAAGISHEIRNPMTTVRGFLQLLSTKKENEENYEYYKLMIEELDRANSIITEFLSMGNTRSTDLKELNLNTIIHDIDPLLHADAFNQNKQLVFELNEIPNLKLNRNEIRQLILNLFRNGLEAMEAGQTLTVRTYEEEEYVVLSVKDQGIGIKPEVLKKLGTPFFSTKDNGTGLGLGVCYAIAARHQAKIEVETGSEGSTFFVKFEKSNVRG